MRGFPSRVYAGLLTGVLACAGLGLAGIPANAGEVGVIDVGLSGSGDVVRVSSAGVVMDPGRVASGLPVRVVVSYSDGEVTVSDPSVVAGRSGRVRIDVGVFNATGRLEKVSGDVNGRSVSVSRWVQVPLSVAGSVRLDGVDPSQVVMGDATGGGDATNGVVGVDGDGTTVVQWAGLTGLGSDVARFSLVVDAKDFVVPSVDVLVQPGFGVGADVDAQRSQSELVTETLKSLSDAGQVLADSGEALGRARDVLGLAGSQIGVKTVADLNASNARVASSASQIASSLNGIEARASGMFSATGSHVAGQLSATTKLVKDLLGDPAGMGEPVVVDPVTCTLEPASGQEAGAGPNDGSVLGVVRGLSARLDALAASSAHCQQLLLGDVDTMLGPALPNAQRCSHSDGLSCRLWQAEQNMTVLVEDNYQQGHGLVESLKDGSDEAAVDAVAALGQRLDAVGVELGKVVEIHDSGGFSQSFKTLRSALVDVDDSINGLEKVFDTTAVGVGRIGDLSQAQDEKLRELKRVVCLASGLTTSDDPRFKDDGHRIGAQVGQDLVSLISDTSCPREDPGAGNSVDGDWLSGGRDSLQGLGKSMREQITSVSEDIAPVQGGASVPKGRQVLADLRGKVSDLDRLVDGLEQDDATSRGKLNNAITALEEAYGQVRSAFREVESDTGVFAGHVSDTAVRLDRHVEGSRARALQVLAGSQPVLLDGVGATRERLRDTSGRVFAGFSDRLGAESKTLVADTSAVVDTTSRGVEQANEGLKASTGALMEENASGLHSVVSAAVVDAEATSKLLADDIVRVLADIGTNTDKGQGLLGAIATSASHLGVADSNLADSTKHMSLTQSRQRDAQSGFVLDDAALRLALSHLENPQILKGIGQGQGSWVSLHLQVSEGR